MGVSIWGHDDAGHLIVKPTGEGLAGRWLRSNQIRAGVEATARQWLAENDPQAVEIFPGCRLIPLAIRIGSRRLGSTVALTIGPAFFDQAEFMSICLEAGLDPAETRRDLEDTARGARIDADQIERILRWSHEDLFRAAFDRNTLNEFSERLAHSYEEITLLYDLSRSMNRMTDAVRFLEQTLHELLENLPFGWIAVRFGHRPAVVGPLKDRWQLAGVLPCEQEAFGGSTAEVLERIGTDNRPLLLSPDEDGLGSLTGSEVTVNPITHDDHVIGAVLAGNKGGPDSEISSMETKFLEAAANFLGVYHENAARYAEQRSLFLGSLQALTASIDAKDRYTCGHSERVAYLVEQLALRSGMDTEMAEQYRIGGLVHDVGKIGVSEAVLCKAGRLTDSEFEEIKRHPVIGYEILKDIPPLADLLPGVLYHHERLDGAGYPEGLAGDQIPTIARTFAVADAFDAMSSTRSYRPAMPRPTVLGEIVRCTGTQFDPRFAKILPDINLDGYDALVARHQNLSTFAA